MSGRGAERILQVIEWMASVAEPVSFSQVVGALNLPKSSTLDLLRILVDAGYCEKIADGRYQLIRLPGEPGEGGQGYATLLRHAEPFVCQAVDATKESGFVAVLTADMDVQYILKVLPDREIKYDRDTAIARRPHQVSSGIVLLAGLSAGDLQQYAKTERSAGRYKGTDQELVEQVETAARAGFQVTAVGIVEGAGGVAAPIFGRDGKIVGALNIAGPAGRIGAQLDEIGPVLREAAAGISKALQPNRNH